MSHNLPPTTPHHKETQHSFKRLKCMFFTKRFRNLQKKVLLEIFKYTEINIAVKDPGVKEKTETLNSTT